MTTIKGLLLGIFLVLLGMAAATIWSFLLYAFSIAAVIVVFCAFYLGDD